MNIYEISVLAGVAPSTVSKVLNQRAGVSEKTRKKVMDVVAASGFQPKLVVSERNHIAFIFQSNDRQANIFGSNFLIEILGGVCDELLLSGYVVSLYPSTEIPHNKEEFSLLCRKNHIAGCIFGNAYRDDFYIEELAGVVPMAVINADFHGERLYTISSDDYSGMYGAVKYLYEMGHRRIALAASVLRFQSNWEKWRGYHAALEDLGLPSPEDYVIRLRDFTASFADCWKKLGERGMPMPTAIAAMNDEDAVRIQRQLKDIGVDCPADVSIVGYDDYRYVGDLTPALTTVRQVLFEKGRIAAKLACGCDPGQLGLPYDAEHGLVLTTELVVRDTVRSV